MSNTIAAACVVLVRHGAITNLTDTYRHTAGRLCENLTFIQVDGSEKDTIIPGTNNVCKLNITCYTC